MEQYFATGNILKSSLSEFLSTYSKRDGGEKQIVSYINKLSSSSKTRHRGLTILIEAIPHLSSNIINDNVMNWLKYCIVLHSGDTLREVRLMVLAKLIASASSRHDFDKNFLSENISKVLEMCLESTSNHNQMEVALECLTVCLDSYPNWFNPHVKKIEHFLLKCIDHTSQDVVIKASKAFHNLQQSGGGGLNRVNYISNFTTSFHKLCENVSSLLNDIAGDFIEIEKSTQTEISPYDLTPIEDTAHSVDTYYRTSQRLINCVYYLKTMLQKPFSAVKVIKPKILLAVISKGMAIHVCVDKENVEHEEWHRSEIIKKVQIHLLYLLQLLLVWLRSNAFPFSYTISKIFVDALVRTDRCNCFKVNHLYFQTLNHVYVQWINMIKVVHSGFQMRVFNVLINNIVPTSSKVSLNTDVNITKSKSKKLKRKAIEERIVASGNEGLESVKTDDEMKHASENNAVIALRSLKALLSVTVGNNREIIQKIYKITMGIALNIQAGRSTDPYKSTKSQIELFNFIVAFLEQETISSLISIHPISRILANGSTNHNKDISLTCERGLRLLEKICQPVCPYLTSSSVRQEGEQEIETSLSQNGLNDREIESIPDNTKNIAAAHIEAFTEISTFNESQDEILFKNVPNTRDDDNNEENITSNKTIKILSVQTITPSPTVDADVNSVTPKEDPIEISDAPMEIEGVVEIEDEDNDTIDLISDEENTELIREGSKKTPSQKVGNSYSEDMIIDTVNKLVVTQDDVKQTNGDFEDSQSAAESLEKDMNEADEDMFASFVDEVAEY